MMLMEGKGPVIGGSIIIPAESKIIDPVTGVTGAVTSASGTEIA
jgi:hypothetical protein